MFDKSKIMCDFRLHVVSSFLFPYIKNLYNIFWCFSFSPTTSRRPPYSPNFMFLLSLSKKIKRRKDKVKTNKFKSRKSIGQNVLKPNKRHMQKTWSPFCDGQLLLYMGTDLVCGWCSTGKTFPFLKVLLVRSFSVRDGTLCHFSVSVLSFVWFESVVPPSLSSCVHPFCCV